MSSIRCVDIDFQYISWQRYLISDIDFTFCPLVRSLALSGRLESHDPDDQACC